MSGPIWLVTGASSGVGRSLSVALAAAGATVLLTARDTERLKQTAAWCGPLAQVLPADLGRPESVRSLSYAVLEALSGRPLAGLVHAAGLALWNSPEPPSGWSLVPLVNAVSPWRLTLALEAPLTAAPGSRVLFIAGAPFTLNDKVPQLDLWRGERPGLGLSLALEAASAKVWMTRALHRRWEGRGSVFAFHPGFIKSNLADGLPFPLNLLGCLAQPFLAARSHTGEFLALDPKATAFSGTLVSGRHAALDCPTVADPSREEPFLKALEDDQGVPK